MKIFAAGLATETNTFAPFPTGHIAYEEAGVFRGDGSAGDGSLAPMLKTWKAAAQAAGDEFVEGFSSFAQPAGTTVRLVYEAYRDEILADLDARGPFDIVLLALHGAMVADGYEDCEGDLLAHIRARSRPDAVIGGVLDPHFHLTEKMLLNADVLIAAKEYPHIDFAERAQEVFDLCVATWKGELRPTFGAFDCRMIGWYPTTSEPMRSLVARARAMEAEPGVLSASIAHGFPWADVADVGTRVLVIADGDRELAAAKAEELGRAIYAERHALLPTFPPLAEALDRALSLAGRVVVADVADNAGGGAPSDNTAMLCGPTSDDPLDLDVVVRGVSEDHRQTRFGASSRLGPSVWIEIQGIDVVISSIRSQTFSPDAFTNLGIDLGGKRLVAVKSSQHFQAGFRPIADHIIQAATSGTMQMDFAVIPYSRRDTNYFPRVDDPLMV
jgi:microcystin degradation protein MlrC